ncbi:MAG: hypothetical protein JSW52_08930 [Candidatus Coatesbacteria bacterium]|nr:MAG: hypothetical protein JSW52_08930 [Candidatus Coatesbacteria bacterium]
MRAIIVVAVFLAFVAGAFGYCEEFSMDLIVDSGGGADFSIEYDSTDPEYCNENTGTDICDEYEGSGGDVENVVITTHGAGPDRVEVSYDVDFDGVEDTGDYGVFGMFSDIDYTLTLDQGTDNEFKISIYTDIPNNDDYKQYMYDFKVICPSQVLSTNGETSPADPREVTWPTYGTLYTLVENGTTDLTITY